MADSGSLAKSDASSGEDTKAVEAGAPVTETTKISSACYHDAPWSSRVEARSGCSGPPQAHDTTRAATTAASRYLAKFGSRIRENDKAVEADAAMAEAAETSLACDRDVAPDSPVALGCGSLESLPEVHHGSKVSMAASRPLSQLEWGSAADSKAAGAGAHPMAAGAGAHPMEVSETRSADNRDSLQSLPMMLCAGTSESLPEVGEEAKASEAAALWMGNVGTSSACDSIPLSSWSMTQGVNSHTMEEYLPEIHEDAVTEAGALPKDRAQASSIRDRGMFESLTTEQSMGTGTLGSFPDLSSEEAQGRLSKEQWQERRQARREQRSRALQSAGLVLAHEHGLGMCSTDCCSCAGRGRRGRSLPRSSP